MPLVLAVDPQIIKGDALGGLRRERLCQGRKISLFRGGIHAALIKGIERLGCQCTRGAECVQFVGPRYSFKVRTEPELMFAPDIHHILGNLVLGSGYANRKRKVIIGSREASKACRSISKIQGRRKSSQSLRAMHQRFDAT